MKFTVTQWNIKKLYDLYKKNQINLSPLYQRNFIWSINDQRYLIDSIQRGNPIPNFFLLEIEKNKFEMVDGQQRSRTILSFIDNQFTDLNNKSYALDTHPEFLNYNFPVTIITDTEGESIEKFYAVVNKTGVHLNKPEVRKADYYNTNILGLINEIKDSKKFSLLGVFSETSLKRMNDVEFVSELLVLIEKGNVDKKTHLDEYFENDITKESAAEIKSKFNYVLDRINLLNDQYSISKTRYKQRNDFYTLFDFILRNQAVTEEELAIFYKILVLIGSDIKPSQDQCIPFQDYARNCVTQSNSKTARAARNGFFTDLLLNFKKTANSVQKQVLKFYDMDPTDVLIAGKYTVINYQKLGVKKDILFK